VKPEYKTDFSSRLAFVKHGSTSIEKEITFYSLGRFGNTVLCCQDDSSVYKSTSRLCTNKR